MNLLDANAVIEIHFLSAVKRLPYMPIAHETGRQPSVEVDDPALPREQS
jgi:hypothetical protein